jgi:hypothetical protein
MGIDGGITGSSRQVLVLTVGDVEMSLWVTILLGQTEIDDIDLVATLTNTHEEVVGLDITVDEGLGVNVLNTGDELIGEEKNGLQGELAIAEVKEILQTGPEEIQNHGIVVALGTEPANEGDSDSTSQGLVDTSLIFELGVLSLDRLKLDGNLFARDDVGAEIDITETSTSDFATDTVLVAYAKIHSSHLELWTLDIGLSDTRVERVD